MKARVILLVCAVLTVGAIYGRYEFLRDRGLIDPQATFVDYVLRRADRKPQDRETGPVQPEPAEKPTRPETPEKKQPPPEKKAPEQRAEAPKVSPAEIARAVDTAQDAVQSGRYEDGLQALEGLPGPEAAQLRYHAALLAQMVHDVDVDPGAGKERIITVRLVNGNPLYAVKADHVGEKWQLRLADGIGAGIPDYKVESVTEEKADAFHQERRTILKDRLKRFAKGGVFDQWKGIRLAWRRGFPREAYGVFQKLAAERRSLEALETALPPEQAQEIARLRKPLPVEIAMKPSERPHMDTAPVPGETVPSPAEHVATIAMGDDAEAFRAVDATMREAQAKIHEALTAEGAESDTLIKQAGRLLTQTRQELLSGTYPEGEARDRRLHQVTLLLDDFLKVSSFGLK